MYTKSLSSNSRTTPQKEYKDRSLHKEFVVARAMEDDSCPDCAIKNIPHQKHKVNKGSGEVLSDVKGRPSVGLGAAPQCGETD